MTKGKKPKYEGVLCAYCGLNQATTADHVLPKCLFLPPLPSNLIKIPSCWDCNQKLSRHQDYLRDFLITDARVENHPTVLALLAGPLRRAVHTNRSRLARDAQASPNGSRRVPIDTKLVYTLFQLMVRGMFYYLYKEQVPENYQVTIIPADPNDSQAKEKVQTHIRNSGTKHMTKWGEYGDVIAFLGAPPIDNPRIYYGVLIFYLGIYMEVVIHPNGWNWQLPVMSQTDSAPLASG